MFRIGCHLSSSKGYLHMAKEILSIGGNTFQFFTRNPRGGTAKPLDLNDVAAYNDFSQENNIGPILAHAPYTLNLCSQDEGLRDFARRTMADDLFRLSHIPGAMYNFHPGSHTGQGSEAGIAFISDALNELLTPETSTTVLLETMAGKGSEVGRSFEELRAIIDRTEYNDRLGVCLDTCHVSDGGYDIIGHLDDVLSEFDRVIGIGRLKAIHLNDSKNVPGSHKDRHEKIGEGCIGLEALTKVMCHPLLRDLPFYLETPNELDGYGREISLLKEIRKNA